MNRFINYLKDTKAEMAHVTWPSRRETVGMTAVVIVVSVATAAYLGFFDYVFSLVLQKFVI
jgi:preprotein translocase subunit SecE